MSSGVNPSLARVPGSRREGRRRSPGDRPLSTDSVRQALQRVLPRNIPTHSVTAESVNPPVALLKVNRISRYLQVNKVVAPRMEVDTFLANARGHQNEWPKR